MSLKIPTTISQDLSAGPLSFVTSIGRNFKLESVSIHFSVAVTETIEVTRDSGRGANYDTVLSNRSLVSNQDYIFRPQGEENEFAGDEIKITITNANATGIAYVEIKTSPVLM